MLFITEMDDEQFNVVTGMTGPDRYAYFIGRAAEWMVVWTLSNEEGFVTLGDDKGNVCVPIWPHRDFANALAKGDWSDCEPEMVDINTFLQKWAQGMARAGYLYAVFPTVNNSGTVVEPDRLRDDLIKMLEGNKREPLN
jgi:hypothetical protein